MCNEDDLIPPVRLDWPITNWYLVIWHWHDWKMTKHYSISSNYHIWKKLFFSNFIVFIFKTKTAALNRYIFMKLSPCSKCNINRTSVIHHVGLCHFLELSYLRQRPSCQTGDTRKYQRWYHYPDRIFMLNILVITWRASTGLQLIKHVTPLDTECSLYRWVSARMT